MPSKENQSLTISEQYDQIIKKFNTKIKITKLRQDSEEYQIIVNEVLNELLNIKKIIYNDIKLFSSNETIKDFSTKSLKFLLIDYYIGLLFEFKLSTNNQIKNFNDRNKIKLNFLKKSIQLFMQFLISLENFNILDIIIINKIKNFESIYEPKLNELFKDSANKNNSNSNIMLDKDTSDAMKRRSNKIEFYSIVKDQKNKIDYLRKKLSIKRSNEDDLDEFNSNISTDHEEMLRELYIDDITYCSYNAINRIEQILYEIDLLENFLKHGMMDDTKSPQNNDKHEDLKDPTGYTDKLETLNKPLISKNGKILGNFTLIDKKTELKNKVKGYGQYGPTMTVEEFLAKEWEDNRVLQGGESEIIEQNKLKEELEDNIKYQDEQTYKARNWDDFTEANPKGSGNTMNLG